MYSIFETGGKQYTVKEGDVLAIDRVDKAENDSIEFSNILLLNDDKEVKIGSPYVENAKVEAVVLEHVRDKKVIAFKFKRRKNYKKMQGHKQPYTMIKIEKILTA